MASSLSPTFTLPPGSEKSAFAIMAFKVDIDKLYLSIMSGFKAIFT